VKHSIVLSLRVVTWNIRLGLEVEAAIREIQEIGSLASADVWLLQEMDEPGAAAIADALNSHYVYASITPHAQTNRDFGNAIISPWPLRDATNLELPHQAAVSGHPRSAVRAKIRIENRDTLLYSIHTEIPALPLTRRVEQFEAIADDIRTQSSSMPDAALSVIVGGDFNTATPRGLRAVKRALASGGLQHASAGAGPTFRQAGVGVRLDHMFTRGFRTTSTGVGEQAQASDHKPLWVELAQEEVSDV